MKGLTGFIVVIFLISLSAGLMYYHCNATKEPINEVPDSTMTFDPDTTAADIPQDNLDMYITIMVLEQIQNSYNL